MPLAESPALEGAFGWKSYSVQRSDKEPLLKFIIEGLKQRGCTIRHMPDPGRAPFYIVFETPAGERHGLLAYAFFANSKTTNRRPDDEHRFQIKYGGDLKGILEVAVDPRGLVTTIFLGIDPMRGIFVAADPLMNNPSPMSRSIEFKSENVTDIMNHGWSAWERDRHKPKTKSRPVPDFSEDTRTQIMIGGTREHIFDLVMLERLAQGLDPGERHLLADTLMQRPDFKDIARSSHKLLDELQLQPSALFDLIDGASRLKMAVRGWVAETHLEAALKSLPGVTDCKRIEEEGNADLLLRWKGSQPIFIECKNVLRRLNAAGQPKVDFQRTRASKEDPCSRYYKPTEFPVLAACLHAITEEWKFNFALTRELPPHQSCRGRITNNIIVAAPTFTSDPELVFDKCS
jgi:hypothetical protein